MTRVQVTKLPNVTLVSAESNVHVDHEERELLGDKKRTRVESISDVIASCQVRNHISESSARGLPTEPQGFFYETASR